MSAINLVKRMRRWPGRKPPKTTKNTYSTKTRYDLIPCGTKTQKSRGADSSLNSRMSEFAYRAPVYFSPGIRYDPLIWMGDSMSEPVNFSVVDFPLNHSWETSSRTDSEATAPVHAGMRLLLVPAASRNSLGESLLYR